MALSKKELGRRVSRMKEIMQFLVDTTAIRKMKIEAGKKWEAIGEVIRFVPEHIGDMSDKQIVGKVFHEISHSRYGGEVNTGGFSRPEPFRKFAQLVETLEDLRVNRKLMYDFPGTYDTFNEVKKAELAFIEEEHIAQLKPESNFLVNITRREWGLKPVYANEKVEKLFTTCGKSFEEAIELPSTNEMAQFIAEKIWEHYSEIIEEEEGKKEESSEGEEGEKGEKGEKGMGAIKAPEGEARKPIKTDYKGSADEIIAELMSKSEKKKPKVLKKEKNIMSEFSSIKKITGEYPPIGMMGSEELDYQLALEDVKDKIGIFTRRLNSILKDNLYNRRGGQFRSGKLNSKILYKWKCNSTRLFSKKIMKLHRRYSVCLLVDESGSMRGEKSKNAMRTAVLFAETLNKVGVNFSVRGFNGDFHMYKEFNTQFTWDNRKIMMGIVKETYSKEADYNNDGLYVALCIKDLEEQEGEKILVVISDGRPEEDYSPIDEKLRRKLRTKKEKPRDFNLSEEIEKGSRSAHIIGVGVKSRHVADYYRHHVVVEDISEVAKETIKVLSKQIKRG